MASPELLPWGLNPPSAEMLCGVSPTWPMTATPAPTSARAAAALWGPPPVLHGPTRITHGWLNKMSLLHAPLHASGLAPCRCSQGAGCLGAHGNPYVCTAVCVAGKSSSKQSVPDSLAQSDLPGLQKREPPVQAGYPT